MKKFVSMLLALVLLFSLSACSQSAEQSYSRDFLDLFDTASTITAVDSSQQAFDAHYETVYNELATYSRLYDIYNSYGDLVNLKYINENAAAAPVKADEKIIDLLLWGKEAYEISGGRVNIAMGAVLSVWHEAREYGIENPDSAYLPDMQTLSEKAQHTDINDLVIDEEASTVYFADPELRIDAGAVAKGYICDRICEFITENGIWDSALVNLGGNVKTLGYKDESGTPFSIGIEDPQGGFIAVVNAANGLSVVTSGSYQRYYTVNGVDYCHIIDPETLMPARGNLSTSILCESSALADVLSTMLFMMDSGQALALIEETDGCEAVIKDESSNVYSSSGFGEFVNES